MVRVTPQASSSGTRADGRPDSADRVPGHLVGVGDPRSAQGSRAAHSRSLSRRRRRVCTTKKWMDSRWQGVRGPGARRLSTATPHMTWGLQTRHFGLRGVHLIQAAALVHAVAGDRPGDFVAANIEPLGRIVVHGARVTAGDGSWIDQRCRRARNWCGRPSLVRVSEADLVEEQVGHEQAASEEQQRQGQPEHRPGSCHRMYPPDVAGCKAGTTLFLVRCGPIVDALGLARPLQLQLWSLRC